MLTKDEIARGLSAFVTRRSSTELVDEECSICTDSSDVQSFHWSVTYVRGKRKVRLRGRITVVEACACNSIGEVRQRLLKAAWDNLYRRTKNIARSNDERLQCYGGAGDLLIAQIHKAKP